MQANLRLTSFRTQHPNGDFLGFMTAWKVISESSAGSAHLEHGIPCQDAYFYRVLPGDILVAAISDGAGSALYGQIGAQLVVKSAVDYLEQHLPSGKTVVDEEWEAALRNSLLQARADLELKAGEFEHAQIEDFAATFLLLVATSELVAAAQVGDGAMVLGREIVAEATNVGSLEPGSRRYTAETLLTPQRGEYVNVTNFVTHEDPLTKVAVRVHKEPPQYLAMFTDGIELVSLHADGTPSAGLFARFFDFILLATDMELAKEEVRAFFHSPPITARVTDDLTLLLAHRESSSPNAEC
jgi:serine/threonine protein phosphatase PrpC